MKEKLKEAKRYLKRKEKEWGTGALAVTPASALSAAVVAPHGAPAKEMPCQPPALSAAAVAAQKVAAARAAALEEDAFLAQMGAPHENLLSFRAQGLGSFAHAADEDGSAAAAASKSKRWRKEDVKERLDEIAPKATGRDALLEKRAAARQANRDAAAAKEDAALGGMLGDELGGGDDFAAVLASRRRAQEFRARRRGVPTAEQAAARVSSYVAKEEEKMAAFRHLVGGFSASTSTGEKMHIPRRE